MECGPQCTGGYFADPPFKVVPDLEHVGLPMAIVEENGDAIITKLPGSGGVVNRLTILEQMYYEIDNPAEYKHTDAIVDFSETELTRHRTRRGSGDRHQGTPEATQHSCLHEHGGGLFGRRRNIVWRGRRARPGASGYRHGQGADARNRYRRIARTV